MRQILRLEAEGASVKKSDSKRVMLMYSVHAQLITNQWTRRISERAREKQIADKGVIPTQNVCAKIIAFKGNI